MAPDEKCERCGGTGVIPRPPRPTDPDIPGQPFGPMPCPACKGTGQEARITRYGDGIFLGFIVGCAIVMAWITPVGWYWKVGIFLVIMFAAGMMVQASKYGRRNLN